MPKCFTIHRHNKITLVCRQIMLKLDFHSTDKCYRYIS